jgi:subtilisin
VKLDSKATHKAITTHAKSASLKLASFSDYSEGVKDFHKAFDEADGIVFEQFGVAVINEDKEKQVSILTESSSSKNTFIYSEPERYVYALPDSFEEFMRGYKSAVDDIFNRVTSKGKSHVIKGTASYQDDAIASWGIHATNILSTQYSGKGVNVAILDTGFNLKHSDFVGRTIISKSFIKGQKVDDQNGHGSHCIGISTGNINKNTGRRYGVAKDANIYIGKVLSNAGSGSDSGILAGMEWAITNGCKIISMSLGAPVEPGETYSNIYNDLAKKALSKGTLIVAAAGNESRRDRGRIAPVGHPANCPAIMAVAALDSDLDIAYFSCGGINSDGGQIDIAAPGVDIYSSWKSPDNYNTISGTSMATPFVAGIAALYWEQNPKRICC